MIIYTYYSLIIGCHTISNRKDVSRLHIKLAPSMMCADVSCLPQTLAQFQQADIDYLHIDVMDGSFVPNYALGTDYIRQLRSLSAIPLDIHLMIERPEDKISWFDIQPGEYVTVHVESTKHLHRVLTRIRDMGAVPSVAINPGTPVGMIIDVLDDVGMVLIMAVDPGFAGQQMVRNTLPKLIQLSGILEKYGRRNIPIEVDGNVSFENIEPMVHAGASILVCGSSSIFCKSGTILENTKKIRGLISQ